MYQSHRPYINQNKSNTSEDSLYNSIYMKFNNKSQWWFKKKKEIRDMVASWSRSQNWLEKGRRKPEVMKLFSILIRVWVYASAKTVQLKSVHITVYELYLNFFQDLAMFANKLFARMWENSPAYKPGESINVVQSPWRAILTIPITVSDTDTHLTQSFHF